MSSRLRIVIFIIVGFHKFRPAEMPYALNENTVDARILDL
jgi:hypothetical protein